MKSLVPILFKFCIVHILFINFTYTMHASTQHEKTANIFPYMSYKTPGIDFMMGIVGVVKTYTQLQKATTASAQVEKLMNKIHLLVEKTAMREYFFTDFEQKILQLIHKAEKNLSDLEYKQLLLDVCERLEVEPYQLYRTAHIMFADQLKALIGIDNPHKDTIAHVRDRTSLHPQEIIAQQARQTKADNNNSTTEPELTIGVALSGGGYRAMILTGGYLEGLEESGILDKVTYISSLSGSSWYIAQWMELEGNTKLLNKKLRYNFENELIYLLKNIEFTSIFIKEFINRLLIYKKIYKQPISSVDFFSMLLEKKFNDQAKNCSFKNKLSNQAEHVKNKKLPIPLYSSIGFFQEENTYDFYEYTPWEMTNLSTNACIPLWSFGRSFTDGHSLDFAPEPPLSFFLALWGSAYTASFDDIKKINELTNRSLLSTTQKIVFDLKQVGLATFNYVAGKKRVSPARIFNPFKKYNDNHSEQEYITLLDSGLHANIALAPLLVPERTIDIIIVADSSIKNQKRLLNGIPVDLISSINYAKSRYGYEYKREYFFDNYTKHVMPVLHDSKRPEAPVIIYIDFQNYDQLFKKINLANDKLADQIVKHNLLTFDPQSNHLETFNFNYKAKEFDQLQKIAEFNVLSQAEELKEIIDHVRLYKKNISLIVVPGQS